MSELKPHKMPSNSSQHQATHHHVPALNKYMHSRNLYRTPPSFKQLASLYPDFRKHCTYDLDGKVRLDFGQPQALAELAIALLHKDFALKVSLPANHLVPTIPLRLNYLLWMQDLVGLWSPRVKTEQFDLQKAIALQEQQKQQHEREKEQGVLLQQEQTEQRAADCSSQKCGKKNKRPQYVTPVIGLDIGCGASCVYGLLGARHCGFMMLGTDTDQNSLATAHRNVVDNSMEKEMLVVPGSVDSLFGVLQQPEVLQFVSAARGQGEEDDLMDVDNSGGNSCSGSGYIIDFSMCNPPFFSSEQEVDSCSKSKKDRGPPPNAHTGTIQETVVEGGEIEFINKMIQESILNKDKIRVFSSLVGTAADLKRVKKLLSLAKPSSYTVTEFCQGRTMRWGVAWTWCQSVPLSQVQSRKQVCTAKPLVLAWPRSSCLPVYTVSAAWEAVSSWLRDLKVKPKVFKSSKYFVGAKLKAYKALWQGQRLRRREEARRNRALAPQDGVASPSSSLPSEECLSPVSISTDCSASSAATSPSGAEKRRLPTVEEQGDERMDDDNPCKKARLDNGSSHEEDEGEDTDCSDDESSDGESLTNVAGGDGQFKRNNGGVPVEHKQTGKPCLLKANLIVKLVNNQLLVEMAVLGGQLSRDGGNQLLTYFRNRLQKRPATGVN